MSFDDVIKYLSKVMGTEGIQPMGAKQNHILISCPVAQWTHSSGHDAHPSTLIWFNDDVQTYWKCMSCGEKEIFGPFSGKSLNAL